ncbi:S-adenosylmethionine decarboxylase [Paenibacillus cremeus]|uniref:S-adenosylmethionine decarboxylase n=1 Tax=Paenibacillus cremeus TaxID=2163881 RepID=A0A559KIC4_9BACL|nr:S-adenosylmethionine decarboxylase [Paenibacillus cremeus]TVY11882.1 S-adenosylmethionine decarboxylase [Paenibacillus cremeus]
MRRVRKKLFMYLIAALLIGWPIIQMVEMVVHHEPQENAEKLLYQVSFFQMELLGSYLTESVKISNTDGFNALRQSVYSAQFAHDHLSSAYGESHLPRLDSLAQLMQYLLRLQIGGGRPLKTEEQQTIAEVNRQYAEIYDAYGKLVTSSGALVSSQADRMAKADKAISELLKKKLLQ